MLKINQTTRRYLVYTSAGDNAFLKLWTEGSRDFDLWITYYGQESGRWSSLADHYNERPGAKFSNLHYVYNAWRAIIQRYEAVMVMDDDIFLTASQINELFALRERNGYAVIQPAFSSWGRISHEITRRDRNCSHRETNFVEMTCPLFHRPCLDRFMREFDPSLLGWGVDHWFLSTLGSDIPGRVAVVDRIPCVNPFEDVAKRGVREAAVLQPEDEQISDWNRIRKRYALEVPEHICFQQFALHSGLSAKLGRWLDAWERITVWIFRRLPGLRRWPFIVAYRDAFRARRQGLSQDS